MLHGVYIVCTKYVTRFRWLSKADCKQKTRPNSNDFVRHMLNLQCLKAYTWALNKGLDCNRTTSAELVRRVCSDESLIITSSQLTSGPEVNVTSKLFMANQGLVIQVHRFNRIPNTLPFSHVDTANWPDSSTMEPGLKEQSPHRRRAPFMIWSIRKRGTWPE